MPFGRGWKEAKVVGNKTGKGEEKERGVMRKTSEVAGKEGEGRAEDGGAGSSWWNMMVEEENEKWKEVKRKKEDDRSAREERRKR